MEPRPEVVRDVYPKMTMFFYGDITERDTMGMGIMFLNLCHVEGIDIWCIPFPASPSFSRCTSNVVHCCSILTGMLRGMFCNPVKIHNSTLRIQVGFQFHKRSIMFHPRSHFPSPCSALIQAAKLNEDAIRTEAISLFQPSPANSFGFLFPVSLKPLQ